MALPPRPRAATFGNTANANRTRDLPPGSVVLGRYTIQKVLGRGGMATVYLAKHQQTDRLVALKLLDPEFSRDPAYVERFRREAKAAGRIRSDHVVAIYDLDAEVGGSLVLVMEYLEGQSMQGALKAGRFPVQKAISFGRQMLEGLAAAHESGVIHRDLKPANLYVERSTTGVEKVKLLDFGISKLADASQQELTRDGQTLGTVAYMAPEQIRGKASATDPRVDLYSAGVSLFIMLTGKRPIDAEDTVQLLAAVLEHPPMTLAQATGLPFPAPLEAFIARSLEKDPNRRFQTAIEMRDALVEAGKVIGYESTGPLSVPTATSEPSGVVPRVPAKTQMGVGGAPPPPTAAKQTMMGMGNAAPPPPTMQQPSSVPAMASSFAPQTLPAPMPGPATMPSPMPGGAPMGGEHDPFGPMPGGLAPPPMTALAAPAISFAAEPAPAPAPVPERKSRAGLVILLSAVGLVALGGAGALVARSMNARTANSAVSVGQSSNNGTQNNGAQNNGAQNNGAQNNNLQNNNPQNSAAPATAGAAGGAQPPAADPNAQQAAQPSAQPAAQPAAQPTQQTDSVQQPTGVAQQPAAPSAQPAVNAQPAVQPQANTQAQDPPHAAGSSGTTATTRTGAEAAPSGGSRTRTPRANAQPTNSNPFDPTPTPAPRTTPATTPATTPRTTTPARTTNTRRRTGTTTVVPF